MMSFIDVMWQGLRKPIIFTHMQPLSVIYIGSYCTEGEWHSALAALDLPISMVTGGHIRGGPCASSDGPAANGLVGTCVTMETTQEQAY